jgi:hypothetical protein
VKARAIRYIGYRLQTDQGLGPLMLVAAQWPLTGKKK